MFFNPWKMLSQVSEEQDITILGKVILRMPWRLMTVIFNHLVEPSCSQLCLHAMFRLFLGGFLILHVGQGVFQSDDRNWNLNAWTMLSFCVSWLVYGYSDVSLLIPFSRRHNSAGLA